MRRGSGFCCACALKEERRRTRMEAFDLLLGIPRIVSADEISVEHGVVAGIAEKDGYRLPPSTFDLHHGNCMVDRSDRHDHRIKILLCVATAVHRKAHGSSSRRDPCGGSSRQRRDDGIDHLANQLPRVGVHILPFGGGERMDAPRRISHYGAAVVVRDIEDHLLARQAALARKPALQIQGDAPRQMADVHRHDDSDTAVAILQRKGLRPYVLQYALHGVRARGIATLPRRLLRRNLDSPHANSPTREIDPLAGILLCHACPRKLHTINTKYSVKNDTIVNGENQAQTNRVPGPAKAHAIPRNYLPRHIRTTPASMAARATALRTRFVSWKNFAPRKNVMTTENLRSSEAAEIGAPWKESPVKYIQSATARSIPRSTPAMESGRVLRRIDFIAADAFI